MMAPHAVLESFVVVLREGIEVALVIGILLAHLRRTGRGAYTRYVLLALASAVLTSLAVAAVVHRFALEPKTPAVEGALMLVAAALVGSLVLWMWRTGKTLKRRTEQRLEALVADTETAVVARRAALGVFGLAFVMVLREGVETVLFLAALAGTVGGRPLSTATGAALGLALATFAGFFLVRGSRRLHLSRFFTTTSAVLSVLVLKLLAGGLHEFIEAGLLPASHAWEEMLRLVTHKTTSLLVLVLLVTVPLGSVAWDWWKTAAGTRPTPEQPNGARP